MRWENFSAIVKRLKITHVEVMHVGGCFLVVDDRIPRAWLCEKPCATCAGNSVASALLTKRPLRFRALEIHRE
jgi:hypothetical protein